MPFTFFAHQMVVLPLKQRAPRHFDATALCIGSMAPDLAYPLAHWLAARSHGWIGWVAWGIPFGVVASMIVRTVVAATAFAHLPDAGRLRLHSLRVIGRRRPPWWTTIVGAAIGSGSHIVLDGFTHTGRFGSRWLGLDRYLFTIGGTPFDGARALQYALHIVGTLAGVAMLASIGRRRLLDAWYGDDLVGEARSFRLALPQRVVFWSIVALGLPVAYLWNEATPGLTAFRLIDGLAASTLLACLIPALAPKVLQGAERALTR